MDAHATDVVTFDLQGTIVRFIVYGTIDYRMNFFL